MCRLITIRAWSRAGRRTIGAHGGVISPADGAGVTAFVRTVLGQTCRHRDFSNWGRSSAELSATDVPSLVAAAPEVVGSIPGALGANIGNCRAWRASR